VFLAAIVCALATSACTSAAAPSSAPPRAEDVAAPTVPAAPPAPPAAAPQAAVSELASRPDWLGTRVLERAADGFGVRLATPPELVDRRLPPPPPHPSLPAAPDDGSFAAAIAPLDAATAQRSTWRAECPVTLDELRHVLVTFVGFDELAHTGELIVHRDFAEDVVAVFRALHRARFPLEEVRLIGADELDLPPTGDGNVTSAFVCRAGVGSSRWSEHAYGRAIDINPFHNPYVKGDLVLPELAGAYVDRTDVRPGMVLPGGVVTEAFAAIGWGWGGAWTSSVDWMHFSTTGR
jgi:hypothetical protein